jgi:hypothetical protein
MRAYVFNIRDGLTQRNAVSLLLRRMNYARTVSAPPGRSWSIQFPEFFAAGRRQIAKCKMRRQTFTGWPFDSAQG